MPKEKFWEVCRRLGVKTPEAKKILADSSFIVKSNFTRISDEMINTLMVALDAQAEAKNEPEAKPEMAKPDPRAEVTVDSGPELPPEPEEVIFFSPSKNHDIAYKKEVYFPGTAKIKDAAQSIRFDEYTYRTSDADEIAHIKNQRSFKVRSTGYPNGKIRIVTEEQLARLKIAVQPKVTEVKSTGEERLTAGFDAGQLNPRPEVIR